jgi:hypothetical protein
MSELINFPRKLEALGLVLDALPASVSKEQSAAVADRVINESIAEMHRELDEVEERNRGALWEMMQPPPISISLEP